MIAAGADLSLQNVDGQTAADLAPTETKGEVDLFDLFDLFVILTHLAANSGICPVFCFY